MCRSGTTPASPPGSRVGPAPLEAWACTTPRRSSGTARARAHTRSASTSEAAVGPRVSRKDKETSGPAVQTRQVEEGRWHTAILGGLRRRLGYRGQPEGARPKCDCGGGTTLGYWPGE